MQEPRLLVASIGFDEGPVIRVLLRTKADALILVYPRPSGEEASRRLRAAISSVREIANMAGVPVEETQLDLNNFYESLLEAKKQIYNTVEKNSIGQIIFYAKGGLYTLTLLLLIAAQSLATRLGPHRVLIALDTPNAAISYIDAADTVPTEDLDPLEHHILQLIANKPPQERCIGVRDTARELKEPKSTIHKKMTKLANKGLLTRKPDGTYCATNKAITSL